MDATDNTTLIIKHMDSYTALKISRKSGRKYFCELSDRIGLALWRVKNIDQFVRANEMLDNNTKFKIIVEHDNKSISLNLGLLLLFIKYLKYPCETIYDWDNKSEYALPIIVQRKGNKYLKNRTSTISVFY